MNKASVVRLSLLILFVALIVAIFLFLPVQEAHGRFVEQVRDAGIWGPVVLTICFIVALLFMIPVTPISLAAGMLFGFWMGLFTVCIGSIVGPALNYFVGRKLAYGWVASLIARKRTLRAIDRAVADQGFKIVLLGRLSPFFPFGILSYVFSLSRVPFLIYLLASFLGVLPCTIAYAYLGSVANDLSDLLEGRNQQGILEMVLLWGGLVMSVIASIYITRVAKVALDEALAASDSPPSPPPPPATSQESVPLQPLEETNLSDAKATL
jgi:uncharacterized membrane protein YdjX (TVP38/TMEM64 family)